MPKLRICVVLLIVGAHHLVFDDGVAVGFNVELLMQGKGKVGS
jgi:hypothetical protein